MTTVEEAAVFQINVASSIEDRHISANASCKCNKLLIFFQIIRIFIIKSVLLCVELTDCLPF